jgi:predicted RNA binding protein YcfA (HicA-like mRNA interferase family)
VSHVRGSHHYLRKLGVSGYVIVPVHSGRDMPSGTLGLKLRQAGLSQEEFLLLLKA